MNKKFINSETFEIVDNIFDVDEYIAETISILNKKGYYTKYCCSGHVKNPRIYELYKNVDNPEKKLKIIGYVINETENKCDILLPYTAAQIYIMFAKNYNFNFLLKGFCKDNNTIEKKIEFHNKKEKIRVENINKMIIEANDVLLEWAKKYQV